MSLPPFSIAPGWECISADGRTLYYHHETGTCQLQPPILRSSLIAVAPNDSEPPPYESVKLYTVLPARKILVSPSCISPRVAHIMQACSVPAAAAERLLQRCGGKVDDAIIFHCENPAFAVGTRGGVAAGESGVCRSTAGAGGSGAAGGSSPPPGFHDFPSHPRVLDSFKNDHEKREMVAAVMQACSVPAAAAELLLQRCGGKVDDAIIFHCENPVFATGSGRTTGGAQARVGGEQDLDQLVAVGCSMLHDAIAADMGSEPRARENVCRFCATAAKC